MPIGKNSIKRVVNNGYSKVSTSAPDMENSTVKEILVAEEKVAEVAVATEEKKIAPKAKTAPKPRTVSKKEAKKAEKSYCNIGDEMPIYLL